MRGLAPAPGFYDKLLQALSSPHPPRAPIVHMKMCARGGCVCPGKMPAAEAQQTAADIVSDFGDGNDLMNGWASLGAGGHRLQHCHRDLMTWAGSFGMCIEPVSAMVHCKNTADHGCILTAHPVLYPHEVFAALYHAGSAAFERVFLGHGELDQYWQHQSTLDWVRHHPAFTVHNVPFKHAIPLGVHADKGQHIKRDKMLCVAWGACTSVATTDWAKLLFTIVPDESLIKNTTDEELYAVLVWSFHHMLLGVWPATDHTGAPWEWGSRRWAMQGKPLAGPYRGVFAEYRGDWEWQTETFQWRCSIADAARVRSRVAPVITHVGVGWHKLA